MGENDSPEGGAPTVEGVAAEWTSVPDAQVGDTITVEGKAEAKLSDGSTRAADSAHVLWGDSLVHRAEGQQTVQTEVVVRSHGAEALTLRAFASGQEDEATETIEIDATPPEVIVSAEEGSDYGRVRGSAQSNETLSRLEIYLLNRTRTDSAQVLSEQNVQEAAFEVEALSFYQPGDTARFSARGEDKAGNASHETAQGVVDGTDLEVEVLRASSTPGEGLVPQEATLTVVDSLEGTQKRQTTTDASGQAVLENLAVGDTVKADDNPDDETIGDFYETSALVESKDDAETTMGVLPNIALQPGDETHEHSLDLIFRAQRFDEAAPNPSVLTIPPHNISPYYEGPPEEIYPMAFAINQNGRSLSEEHRQAIEDGIRSWNGPNRNYQHAKMIEDTTQADWILRIADESEGLKREQRAILIREPPLTFPPEALQKESAHQAYHALELGPFAHLDSPLYVGNTNFGDDRFPTGATRAEVEILHSLINLRTIYDSGRNLEELYGPE